MGQLRQLSLLIWKNFKLQSRHPYVTLLELGVPAFFSLILVLIRSAISSEFVSSPILYEPFPVHNLPANLTPPLGKKWQVLYTPRSPFLDGVMEDVATALKAKKEGFDDENLMLEYFTNTTSLVLSGIVFKDDIKNGVNDVTNITYTIRPKTAEGGNTAFENTTKLWYTQYTFPIFPALGPRNKPKVWGGSPGYMSQGFLTVQHAVADSLMKRLTPDPSKIEDFSIEMCRYPYPPYLDDKFVLALQLFFPMIICFSFIYPSVNIVKNIVIEKEKKLKEAMKMMGLSRWLHWTAWYFKYFLFLFLSCCIMTVLLCVKFSADISVINYSNPSVILFWLVAYIASSIAFSFFLSTFFSKANSSAAGAGVIFFLTFVPYFFILPRYNDMALATKIFSCLLPNIAIAMGSIVLTVSEASGNGLQWSNVGTPATPDDTLTMSIIFIMFVVDIVIYLILTWYLELAFPGEYGIPERWYFPFMKSYWCGQHSNFNEIIQLFNSNPRRSEFFERDPVDLMPGIQIQGLTKVYGKNNVPAANNVHLNMYRSHITVLLGHNGAGKSTTISMLTGLIPPTSGTAIVNGFDICEEMNSVHCNLGICPQHDVLFDELTVDEHLYFFCKLKGYISDLVDSDIDRLVTALNLTEKRKTKVQALSGGWKRKLSVGVALVGGSRIVILDEPTSGMDPFNRRSLWDVLQAEKEDRTILLTTHFMEEADILGDRIAIMANGEVQCCGSPLFLKKKYGAGYHLVMVKGPKCEVPPVTNLILSHVPTAEMSSNIGSELKYILPHDSSRLFHDLFEELERRKGELNISGYGASITTMEEVFIKVGKRDHLEDVLEIQFPQNAKTDSPGSYSPADSGIHVHTADSDSGTDYYRAVDHPGQRNHGLHLFVQHLYALLLKRVLHSLRNWVLTLSQFALPPCFLILTILVLKTLPKPQDGPSMPLSVQSYHGTQIPYLVDTASSQSKALADIYKSVFTDKADQPVLVNSSTGDLNAYLIAEAQKDLGKYNMHNMIGAKFMGSGMGTKITSMFNNQAFHSPAIALLHVQDAMLKYLTNSSFTFSVSNHPLPRTLAEKGKEQQTQTTESYQIAQDIMFGMAFLIASFAIFIIKERGSNSKHLQRVSGVNLFSYWLAACVWDFLNYIIPCCLLLVIFVAFGTEGLSSPVEIGRLFLLFFIHGFSALPFVYCCTFFFMSPSTAYMRLSLFNILIGIACLLTITILEIPDLGVQYVAKPLDTLFSLFFPNYGLGRSVSNLYQNNQFNKFCNHEEYKMICDLEIPPFFQAVKPCCKGKCDSFCIPWEENYLAFNSPGIGKNLMFFALQFVFFTFMLVMCEWNIVRYLKYKFKNRKIKPSEFSSEVQSFEIDAIEDDDVRHERLRILNLPVEALFLSNHLVIKEVSKNYGQFLAVNRLTFGVRKGECFGLLGLNGAGKTTTFKMITGDEDISSGDIYVNGFNIKKETRKVQSRIGYCPQFDALIDQLTGRETLTLYARLRGIKEHLIAGQIIYLSELLTFNAHIDKLVKDYSGGNKRKLSTAVALIGNAPVIFLDEPTTGMDPVSRRSMWHALLQVMQSGRSVVLTSHSMEECEALCTRLVIMVNGKLCCLGSPQHLKSKFGQGFTLMIKVGQMVPLARVNPLHPPPNHPFLSSNHEDFLARDMDEIRSFVERTFASAVLKNAHENLLHYHIPSPQLNWSEIFRAMEEAKAHLNIEDYSVGETTLEQVFLNFALVQRDSAA